MSDKTNERQEREALESLVASDLSARMKQWQNQPPGPEKGRGGFRLPLFLVLLALAGAAWWLWTDPKTLQPETPAPPLERPAPASNAPAPAAPEQRSPLPMAQKTDNRRYIALAQSYYHAPDFSTRIRGDAAAQQDVLDEARRALAEGQPSVALDVLQNVPSAYRNDADYLRAHALFALKKYSSAAAIFGKLKDSVRYGDAAQWYRILALLSDFDREETGIRRGLEKITDDEGHTFHREAQELAADLYPQQPLK